MEVEVHYTRVMRENTSSNSSNNNNTLPPASEYDDAPDEWDQRILKTGCAAENERLLLCHFDTGDWRACTLEMEAFRQCWAAHGNLERTRTVDSDDSDDSDDGGVDRGGVDRGALTGGR